MEAPLKSSDGLGLAVTEKVAGVDVCFGPHYGHRPNYLYGHSTPRLGIMLPTSPAAQRAIDDQLGDIDLRCELFLQLPSAPQDKNERNTEPNAEQLAVALVQVVSELSARECTVHLLPTYG